MAAHTLEHFVVTTPSIEGYRVVQYLGTVRGVALRYRTLKLYLSNEQAEVTHALGRRNEAFDRMVAEAETRGANAIIGVCMDASVIDYGIQEILAYGTAVIIEPLP